MSFKRRVFSGKGRAPCLLVLRHARRACLDVVMLMSRAISTPRRIPKMTPRRSWKGVCDREEVYSEGRGIRLWDLPWRANSSAVSSRMTRAFRSSIRLCCLASAALSWSTLSLSFSVLANASHTRSVSPMISFSCSTSARSPCALPIRPPEKGFSRWRGSSCWSRA